MATMASWRKKTFEVSRRKVNPIKNFTTSTTIKSDNSKSMKKTTELVPIKFDVDLHSAAGVDPQKEYEDWCSLIESTGILYLHGERWGRETRLKDVSLSGVTLDDFGRIRFATIGLSFEEVNEIETDETAGSDVTASASDKAEKKPTKNKGNKVSLSVGSSVKLTNESYVDGEKATAAEKQKTLTVGKISGNKAYISQIDGWVYTDTVSLVS